MAPVLHSSPNILLGNFPSLPGPELQKQIISRKQGILMLKKYIHIRVERGLVMEVVLDFHPAQAQQQQLPPITGCQLLGPVNPHPVGHARPPEKIELRTFHNLWQLLEQLLRQLKMNWYLLWRTSSCAINLYGCHREEMSLSIDAHQRDKVNMATHLRSKLLLLRWACQHF